MISIRELAKLADVSPATVSRVINGTAKVDEIKKNRVLETIRETGYQPNELALSLFRNSSKMIGIILSDIENPFFSELSKAIEDEAYGNGYKMLLCNSDNNTEKEKANIRMLHQLKADGLIIITNNEETNEELLNSKIPVVIVDRTFDSAVKGSGGILTIESDHYQGGRLAAEHLVECGCSDIVFLRGPIKYSSGYQRYRGYLEICKRYKLKIQYVDCLYQYRDGVEKTEELLKRYPKVDGIIACNDMVAIASYKVLHDKGIRVPEDVQLIGYDDISFSEMFVPKLTTIRQDIKTIGIIAVNLLLQKKAGKKTTLRNTLPVSLVQRETTKWRECK